MFMNKISKAYLANGSENKSPATFETALNWKDPHFKFLDFSNIKQIFQIIFLGSPLPVLLKGNAPSSSHSSPFPSIRETLLPERFHS